MKQSIGNFLLRRLQEAGIRHIFGVPGDYNLGLMQQLEDRGEPAWNWMFSYDHSLLHRMSSQEVELPIVSCDCSRKSCFVPLVRPDAARLLAVPRTPSAFHPHAQRSAFHRTICVSGAMGYAMHYSRSHDAVIRLYDDGGNVTETHERCLGQVAPDGNVCA